jgi:hypothetical protein
VSGSVSLRYLVFLADVATILDLAAALFFRAPGQSWYTYTTLRNEKTAIMDYKQDKLLRMGKPDINRDDIFNMAVEYVADCFQRNKESPGSAKADPMMVKMVLERLEIEATEETSLANDFIKVEGVTITSNELLDKVAGRNIEEVAVAEGLTDWETYVLLSDKCGNLDRGSSHDEEPHH